MPLLLAMIVTLAVMYLMDTHRSQKPALQKVSAAKRRKIPRDDRDW